MRSRPRPISPLDTTAMAAHRASMAALARLTRAEQVGTAEALVVADAPLAPVFDLAEVRARRGVRHSHVG